MRGRTTEEEGRSKNKDFPLGHLKSLKVVAGGSSGGQTHQVCDVEGQLKQRILKTELIPLESPFPCPLDMVASV